MIRNADDFGYRGDVNSGIVKAFELGLATSTSLMANGPGFEEACELARDHDLRERIGVHLVLTYGTPLTEPIRRSRFCDAEGRFYKWRGKERVFGLSRETREALAAEIRAQVERCREHGITPTHLDSHHHAHNEWAIGGVAVAVAREQRLPRVRLARNCGPGIGVASMGYKRLFNTRIARNGLAGTRYFGDVDDWLHLRDSGASTAELDDFELMTHPVLAEDGSVVDPELGARSLEVLLAPVVADTDSG